MSSTVIRVPMPVDPWGANQAPTGTRQRIEQHNRKVTVRDAVTMLTRSRFARCQSALPFGPSNVHVQIPFSTNRRRDPHNYTSTVVKAVIDGLRNAGVFTDDTEDYLSVIDPTLYVGSDLVITIYPRTVRKVHAP